MKKSIFAAVCLLCLLPTLVFSGCKNESEADDTDVQKGETVMIEIEMENGGIIKAELYPDIAPITVDNFVSLAKENFYDGIIFHRVIKDFVIQGGDPTGTGYYGSGKNIKGEFAVNGVKNDLSHTRGVLSMARSSNSYDSASSQFFICHGDCKNLDGQYAAFGKVVEGMDVVDAIANQATDSGNKPLEDQVIKTIRVID